MPGHVSPNVNSTDDLAAHFKAISYRLASLERSVSSGGSGGGGSGTDEVWIGAADPIASHPTIELWYDSDAAGYSADDQRWNSAWGVVRMVAAGGSSNTSSNIDFAGPLTWTTVPGRRYRISGSALVAVNTLGTTASLQLMRSGVLFERKQITPAVANAGAGATVVGTIDATTATNESWTLNVGIVSGTGVTYVYADASCRSWLIVEDVGPLVPGGPSPMPASAWANFAFESGWTNYGSGFAPGQYRKVGDDVQLRGLVRKSVDVGPNWVPTVLPVGFRPAYSVIVPVWVGLVGHGNAIARLDVNSAGGVSMSWPSLALAGISYQPIQGVDFLSLEGIHFSTTP